jgi:nitrous oxide reductase
MQEAGIGRYCPHLLASYILLAAAPPSARSRSLLHLSSLAAAAAAGAQGAAVDVAAAAAAEEDVLAGEPLSPEVAAALRQGAYALYGACSAAEVRPASCPLPRSVPRLWTDLPSL